MGTVPFHTTEHHIANCRSDRHREDSTTSDSAVTRRPPSLCETAEALQAMWNGKATSPDGLPAELLDLGLNGEAPEILYHFHSIISQVWISGEVPQDWRDVTVTVLHKKKDRTEYGSYRGVSLVAHAAKALLKIVAHRLGNFCEETDVFPEDQCGFSTPAFNH